MNNKNSVSLWKLLFLYFGVVIFANIIAIISMIPLYSYLRSPAVHKSILFIFSMSGGLETMASFLIPLIFSTIYILPILKSCNLDSCSLAGPLVQKRVINSSLIISLISSLGWGLTHLIFIITGYIYKVSNLTEVIISFSFQMFLTANLVLIFSYYLLEFLIRKLLIPQYFPHGDISSSGNTIKLSVKLRFYIYFYAVAIIPLILLAAVLLLSGVKPFPILFIILGLIVFGIILTFLISHSYQKPLTEMKRVTEHIQQGNYSVVTSVSSNDEIGFLGEGLNEMAQSLKEKEYIKDTFGKMVDPRVRDHLLQGTIELGGSTVDATILFSDIRDFTTLSEKKSPADVVLMLNQFFDAMTDCIESEGGVVNKFIGDAILAVFGAPIFFEDHSVKAVTAAKKMRIRLQSLNEDFLKQGYPQFKIGIGVHTGHILAGTIGSHHRMEYTVIGDAVNVASRIEGLCKETGKDILVSGDVLKNDLVNAQYLDTFNVKGRHEALKIFTIE